MNPKNGESRIALWRVRELLKGGAWRTVMIMGSALGGWFKARA